MNGERTVRAKRPETCPARLASWLRSTLGILRATFSSASMASDGVTKPRALSSEKGESSPSKDRNRPAAAISTSDVVGRPGVMGGGRTRTSSSATRTRLRGRADCSGESASWNSCIFRFLGARGGLAVASRNAEGVTGFDAGLAGIVRTVEDSVRCSHISVGRFPDIASASVATIRPRVQR